MDFIQEHLSPRKIDGNFLSADLLPFQKIQQLIKPRKLRLNLLSPKRINNETNKNNQRSHRNENTKLIQNLNSFRKLFFEQTTKITRTVKKLKSISQENKKFALEIKKLNKDFDHNNKLLFPLESSFDYPGKKIDQIKSTDNIYKENLLLIKDKDYANYFLRNSENINRNLKSLHLLDIMQIETLPSRNNKELRKKLSERRKPIEKTFKRLEKLCPIKYKKKLNLNNFYNMTNLEKIKNLKKDIKYTKNTLSSMEELHEFASFPSTNVNSVITNGTYTTSTVDNNLLNNQNNNNNLNDDKKIKIKKVLKKTVDIKSLPSIHKKKVFFYVNNNVNYGINADELKNLNKNLNRKVNFGVRPKRDKSFELENLYNKISNAKDCFDFSEDINKYYGKKKIPTFKSQKEIKRVDLLFDEVKKMGKKFRCLETLEKICDVRKDKLKKRQIKDFNDRMKRQLFDLKDNIIEIAAGS